MCYERALSLQSGEWEEAIEKGKEEKEERRRRKRSTMERKEARKRKGEGEPARVIFHTAGAGGMISRCDDRFKQGERK